MQHQEGELGGGNKQATIADWTILSSHEPQTSKQQCLLLLLQWPTWASPILCEARTRGHLHQQIALDGFMWMLRVCWEEGGEVHCLEAVDKSPRGSVFISSHLGCMAKDP